MSSTEDPFQGKILISGMLCKFDVIFTPKNVSEVKDVMEVRSEMDTCVVELMSTHPLPTVEFPSSMDCGYCLTGHSCSTSYTFVSQGAEAHFAMLGFSNDLEWNLIGTKWNQDLRWKDVQDRYVKHNFTFFAPFVAYPRMVKVQAEQSQEMIVLFRPPRCGQFSGVLKIETSTGRHWEVLVTGHAVDLDIRCTKLDGKAWREGEFDLGVSFGDSCVGGTTSHTVAIKNHCELPMRFFWRVSEQIRSASIFNMNNGLSTTKDICWERDREFKPLPTFGVLPALSEIQMSLSFTPSHLVHYCQLACLYVDTRMDEPLSSKEWKTFRDHLFMIEHNEIVDEEKNAQQEAKSLYPIHHASDGIINHSLNPSELQAYSFCDEAFAIGKADNMGHITKVLELKLEGRGVPLDVLLVPPLLVVGGGLTIGTIRNFKITVRNNSHCAIRFSWERPGTPSKLGVLQNSVYFQPWIGDIPAYGNHDISVIFKARRIGAFEAKHECRISNLLGLGQLPLLFRVEGHTRGPIITLSPPMLNFGLVQVSDYQRS